MIAEWISSKVRAAAVERKLEAGNALFYSGSKTVGLYEVLNGTVCLVRTDRSGREAILQRASAGDILAEASLFSSMYHCDAVAKTAATVRLYPKAVLLAELQRDPKIAQAFAAMLARQVMTLRTRLEQRNIHSARDRVRHFLAINADPRRTDSFPIRDAQRYCRRVRAHTRSPLSNARRHERRWRDRAPQGDDPFAETQHMICII